MKRANRTLAATAILAAAMSVNGFAAAPAPAPTDKDHKHEEPTGPKHELGSQEIAGVTVKVTQIGAIKPGKEAAFVLVLTGAKEKPKAIRAWVGAETPGEGGKEQAEDEGKEYHAHVEVPEKLPEGAKLWIELETAAGRKVGSFALAAAEKPKAK